MEILRKRNQLHDYVEDSDTNDDDCGPVALSIVAMSPTANAQERVWTSVAIGAGSGARIAGPVQLSAVC